MSERTTIEPEDLILFGQKLFSVGETIIIRRAVGTGVPIQYISENVVDNLGYKNDELIDQNFSFFELIHTDDLLAFQDAIHTLNNKDEPHLALEYRLRDKNNKYRWFREIITCVKNANGEVEFYDGYLQNLTREKHAEIKLKRFFAFDELTKLPNRESLLIKLNENIAQSKSNRTTGCVISINLDRFKYINNSYGYEVGDKLLKEVARRLKKCIRPQDTIARISADEFVCVISEIHEDKDTATKLSLSMANKIRGLIGKTYNIADMTLIIEASFGICMYPEKDNGAENILKFSDMALGMAKTSGQNNVHFFDEKMHQLNIKRSNIEHELLNAFNEKKLELYFQPIVNNDRNIIAFESLIRWNHPEKGFIPPNEFIPVAENTGLLQKLGEYVMDHACHQLSLWEKESIFEQDRIKYLSVNVSPNQFWHTDFLENLSMNIQTKGIDPKHLLIEITENIFIADLQEAINKLTGIKKMGVSIALDDFGSGYSSLSYLMQLPLDIVKLDRAFIQDVHKNTVKATIIKSICAIADELKLKVIAEGLETVEELETLVKYNCHAYQGFYFYRPMPASELNKILQKKAKSGFNDFNNTTELPVTANRMHS